MLGTSSIGIQAPIYRGDANVLDFICNALMDSKVELDDGDIIGITESLVARSQNNYCTIDDIAKSVKTLFPNSGSVVLFEPIASRNRFSYILRGICRAFKQVYIIWQSKYDEVGNFTRGKHPFTGLNYQDLYKHIAEQEGSSLYIIYDHVPYNCRNIIDCRCHVNNDQYGKYTLKDIMKSPIIREDRSESGFNHEYGVLGSNVAGDDRLKLFPRDGQDFVLSLQKKLNLVFHKSFSCVIFADGCFKDPVGGIWEFADPITCPGSTIPWESSPVEMKLKLLADSSKTDEEIKQEIKEFEGHALGTTPRRTNDLLASLMDLTAGSGDKGTPIVLVKNYFTHYGQ